MYSAFVELMQPEIDEAVNKAVAKAVEETWNEAVIETTNNITAQNKVEAIENAIKNLNMTKEEACAFMDTTPEQYDVYKQIMIAANNKNRKGTANPNRYSAIPSYHPPVYGGTYLSAAGESHRPIWSHIPDHRY